jgi:NDP-sugar pyrophosphorylase family protein
MTGRDGRPRRSITAPLGTPRDSILQLLRRHQIRHLPLLDDQRRVADLVTLRELEPPDSLPVQAVIMAGGFGKRLRPLTDDTPKPMLPIGGQPLMERTIQSLRQAGIRRINITTHFLPDKIKDYFGSGQQYDVDLAYVSEDQPLGTAGALSLMEETDEPTLVKNGDILTRVDYRELVEFHRKQAADLTVGVRHYEMKVPYGVIDAEHGIVRQVREKPTCEFLVNAGVYVLQPLARRLIPSGRQYHMTDLIADLLAQGRTVACFPIIEYWLDIGQQDDFQRAQRDVAELKWAA